MELEVGRLYWKWAKGTGSLRDHRIVFRYLGDEESQTFSMLLAVIERVDANASTFPPGTRKRMAKYLFKREFEPWEGIDEQDAQTHHGGSTNPERGGFVDPASTDRAPLGSPVIVDQVVTKREAQELGCTCTWWGVGSIIEFNPNCPVLDRHVTGHKPPGNMRLTRPELFMQVAELFAGQSTCLRGNVGAVIVKDRRIISCGYNGAPPGMDSCVELGGCLVWPCTCDIIRSHDQPHDKTCAFEQGCRRSTHAEANAIAWAARVGVPVIDSVMYATHSPCLACARLCIAAGIRGYVYRKEYRIVEGKELLDAASIPVQKL